VTNELIIFLYNVLYGSLLIVSSLR